MNVTPLELAMLAAALPDVGNVPLNFAPITEPNCPAARYRLYWRVHAAALLLEEAKALLEIRKPVGGGYEG